MRRLAVLLCMIGCVTAQQPVQSVPTATTDMHEEEDDELAVPTDAGEEATAVEEDPAPEPEEATSEDPDSEPPRQRIQSVDDEEEPVARPPRREPSTGGTRSRPNCKKGCPCGNACISCGKTCRK